MTCLRAVLILGFMLTAQIHAGAPTSLTFYMNNLYSGTSPNGNDVWATATFEQMDPNTVFLTMDVSGITPAKQDSKGNYSGQYVSRWDFAFNPQNNVLSSLVFTPVKGTNAYDVTLYDVNAQLGNYDAGPSKGYSVEFNFATSNEGTRFYNFNGLNDAVVYSVYSSKGVSVSDFNALALGNNPFNSAFHVQGIDTGLSGWIGNGVVPEPHTYLMLGTFLSLAFYLFVRRRRQISNSR